MKTLVTGATGFLGAHIVRELLRDGAEVRVLVRAGADQRNLAGLAVDIAVGDLLDRESLARAVKGCDRLFHAAADYRLWLRNPAEMYAANVEGTGNILQAASDAGLAKVVYTSTVGTLGNRGDGTPGDEETPVSLADMVGDYKKSKYFAEQVAVDFARRGLPLVIVNPSTPVGPLDIKPTPTGKLIVDFVSGRMPAYLDTGLNIVSAAECARGHLLAAQKGRIGAKYILGGEDLHLSQILTRLAEIASVPAPRWRLPYRPVLLAAHLNELLASVTGREPLIPLAGVQMAKKLMFFSSKRANMELGYVTSPAYHPLEQAVAWFRENGYLK
jgi:dihydroflavonol-4-reductase